MFYCIDEIENHKARLLSDNQEVVFVLTEELPIGTKEGDVLIYSGEKLIFCAEETMRRKSRIQNKLNKLLGK